MKKYLFTILICSVVLLVLTIFFISRKSLSEIKLTDSEVVTDNNKEFRSDNLNFSLQIPQNYIVSEKSIRVEIITPEGTIYIHRNGTNFETLSEFIDDFDSKRSLSSQDEVELVIGGLNALSRKIKLASDPLTQKSYYIYADGAVYILSTDSEALYNDLDQIAQSFRYTP